MKNPFQTKNIYFFVRCLSYQCLSNQFLSLYSSTFQSIFVFFLSQLFCFSFIHHLDIRWKQFVTNIAGRNDKGNRLDQLNGPHGISTNDQNYIIYIADRDNHRIVE